MPCQTLTNHGIALSRSVMCGVLDTQNIRVAGLPSYPGDRKHI
jgi:hypothetical protein